MDKICALFGGQENLTPACVDSLLSTAPPECSDDYEMSAKFLMEYRGSNETFNAYRREIERFLQWLWRIDNTSLPFIDRESIHRYMAFCEKPPAQWIGDATVARFTKQASVAGGLDFNPAWRPFINPKKGSFKLANSSRKAILSILSSYFNYLIMEGRAPINPVMMIRQKNRYITKVSEKRIIRRLTDAHWQLILDLVDDDREQDSKSAHRALFIFSAFYLMGVRISEIADNEHGQKTMGHFERSHDKSWWFKVIGKGNKERRIPVNDDMLIALKTYRSHRGLSNLPIPGEDTPLLENFGNKHHGLSNRMVRYIVDHYFDLAVSHLKKIDPDEAQLLAAATVHWLRHTSISEQVKIRDRGHVQADAGHSDGKTTDNYADTFDEERHSSMQGLRLRK